MDELSKLRDEINAIDNKLLALIKKRLEIVKQIGVVKRQNDKLIRDKKRETEVLNNLFSEGEKLSLNKKVIKKIWKTFFEISYKIEK